MCGIVGVLAKKKGSMTQKDVRMFTELLTVGQLRGTHGTGIMFDGEKGKLHCLKGAMRGSDFVLDPKYGPSIDQAYQKAGFIIGHNRFATKGAHTFENTHPFLEGDISLVHNGTLYNHRVLKSVEVDSHAICHSINEKGIDFTAKTMDGAFALVWHDKKTKLLNIVRNKERPLHWIEYHAGFIICSELKMGLWILDRNEIKEMSHGQFVVGELNQFDPQEGTWKKRDLELKPPFIYTPATKTSGSTAGFAPDRSQQEWCYTTQKWIPKNSQAAIQKQADEDNKKALLIAQQRDDDKPLEGKVIPFKKTGARKSTLKIGDYVTVFTYKVVQLEKTAYLECTYVLADNTELELRYYNQNVKVLEDFDNNAMLSVRVYQEKSVPSTGEHHYIVTDPSIVVTTKNFYEIAMRDVYQLPHRCFTCEGIFAHNALALRLSDIENEPDKTAASKYRCHCMSCTMDREDLKKEFFKETEKLGAC